MSDPIGPRPTRRPVAPAGSAGYPGPDVGPGTEVRVVMTRRNSTGPKQHRPKAGRPADTEQAGTEPGRTEPAGTGKGRRNQAGQDQPDHDWADEAARARTADDPRRVTPHDRSGVPSTGDSR